MQHNQWPAMELHWTFLHLYAKKFSIFWFTFVYFLIHLSLYSGTIKLENSGLVESSTVFSIAWSKWYCPFYISFTHFLFALDQTNVQWWLLTNWNDAIVQFSIGFSWKIKTAVQTVWKKKKEESNQATTWNKLAVHRNKSCVQKTNW